MTPKQRIFEVMLSLLNANLNGIGSDYIDNLCNTGFNHHKIIESYMFQEFSTIFNKYSNIFTKYLSFKKYLNIYDGYILDYFIPFI